MVVAGGCLALSGPGLLAGTVDRIVAVVHDSVITSADVDSLTPTDLLLHKYSGQSEAYQTAIDKVERENLEQLMNRQLILHEFSASGFSLPESVLDQWVDEAIRSEYTDRRTWDKTLYAQGTSHQQYREKIRDRYIERALIEKNVPQPIVSPHKVEAYYLAHRDEYKVEEQLKLRRINLPQSPDSGAPSAEKMAEEIQTKLAQGATFAEMAALYSQNKQEGEWYELSQLAQHLADLAASLQVGQHSGVISRSPGQDDYWVCQYEKGEPVWGRHYVLEAGAKRAKMAEEKHFSATDAVTNLPPAQEFFLLLLEDKRAAHFTPLLEIRPKIEEELRLTETGRLKDEWLKKLRKKTFVRIFP